MLVTEVPDGAPDAGASADAAIVEAGAPVDAAQAVPGEAPSPTPSSSGSGGCSVGPMPDAGSWMLLAGLPAWLLARRRRPRARRTMERGAR